MTTNKFYNETASLSVYVANLEEYVKGNLVGDWISLPIEESKFEEFLKTIGSPEEIAIHDYEDNSGIEGVEIGEYMSIKELNELGERLESINPDETYIVNALYEAVEDLEQALSYYETGNYIYYGDMTLEEVAQEYIEETYDIPAGLENYIDYKAFARDMRYDNFYKTDYGVIYVA